MGKLEEMTAALALREGIVDARATRDRELKRAYMLVSMRPAESYNASPKSIVDLRIYEGRSRSASVVYALAWINALGEYGNGKGSAGGYGYDKYSAAAGEALESAGVTLSERIEGVGETAIRAALVAIAHAAGYADGEYGIVEAYA